MIFHSIRRPHMPLATACSAAPQRCGWVCFWQAVLRVAEDPTCGLTYWMAPSTCPSPWPSSLLLGHSWLCLCGSMLWQGLSSKVMQLCVEECFQYTSLLSGFRISNVHKIFFNARYTYKVFFKQLVIQLLSLFIELCILLLLLLYVY